MSYIYAGKLTGVNEECILLEEAKIVYETGSFTDKGYSDAQLLPNKKSILWKEYWVFGYGKWKNYY